MAWKMPPSIRAALDEANERWPNRSRKSDGTIGDQAHSNRKSDHNPGARGFIHAFDITHDPANGCDCVVLAEHLRTRSDPRVSYVIFNKRIWNPSRSVDWRPYTGSNPHTSHMHVSILSTVEAENNTSEWWGFLPPFPAPPARPPTRKKPRMFIVDPGVGALFLVNGPKVTLITSGEEFLRIAEQTGAPAFPVSREFFDNLLAPGTHATKP